MIWFTFWSCSGLDRHLCKIGKRIVNCCILIVLVSWSRIFVFAAVLFCFLLLKILVLSFSSLVLVWKQLGWHMTDEQRCSKRTGFQAFVQFLNGSSCLPALAWCSRCPSNCPWLLIFLKLIYFFFLYIYKIFRLTLVYWINFENNLSRHNINSLSTATKNILYLLKKKKLKIPNCIVKKH